MSFSFQPGRLWPRSSRTLTRSTAFACILLLVPVPGNGESKEIHRCEQPDGSTAYQELPCASAPARESPIAADEEAVVPEDDFFDFVNPYDAPRKVQADAATPAAPAETAEVDEACVHATRLAIDKINLELKENPTKDDREIYLGKLMELTRRLRDCSTPGRQ